MSKTTWADIQRLAADLQRVQSADSVKKQVNLTAIIIYRLSESNCIEIISTLLKAEAIDLVITVNGKEYVTRKHLITEVQNECLAVGGRVNLTDLVTVLRVDLDHIVDAAENLVVENEDFVLCGGELIARDYIYDLCKRLNTKLQEVGQLSIYQLSKNWEISMEFFNQYVLIELGTRIDATRFEDQIYTKNFYSLQRNKLRAALNALTKPTPVSTIFAAFDIPQSLFFNLWSELSDAKQLNGHLIGAKGSVKSVFVPRMHELLVRATVKNNYESNRFIETAVLKKLSVMEASSYFKDLLPKDQFSQCVFLQTGVVHKDVWLEVQKTVEEKVTAELFCAVHSALPSMLSDLKDADLDTLVQQIRKIHNQWKVVETEESGTVIYDSALLTKLLTDLGSFLSEKAKEDAPKVAEKLKEHRIQQQQQSAAKKTATTAAVDDDDDWGNDKKKKGGKGGGKKGTAQSAKPKNPQPSQKDSTGQSDLSTILQISRSDLNSLARDLLPNVPDALRTELLDELEPQVNAIYRELVESQLHAVTAASGKDHKKAHEEKRQRAQHLYEQICIFEEGAASLSAESLIADLRAHLLRSLCVDLAQTVLSAFVADLPSTSQPLSAKVRDELIATIGESESRSAIADLFTALKDLSEFHDAVKAVSTVCSFLIRSPDKRRRAELFAEHTATLRNKYGDESDPPSALVLAVLLLFAQRRQLPIHASGKFVVALIRELAEGEPPLSDKLASTLNDAQRLVVECLKKKNADAKLNAELESKLSALKSEILK